MSIEMIFFDAGETLLHPDPSFPELFARVANADGYPIDPSEVRSVQNRLAPHLVELASETGIENPSLDPDDSLRFWSHLYRSLLSEFGIQDEALVRTMYSTFSSTSSYKLFDDVLPALEDLSRRGHRLGLISNFEKWLEEMLVELEVGHHFEVSVISGIEGVEKPDPAIYRSAVERAGVAPEGCLHVGDSPANDVEPALEVGMKAVLLDRYGRYADRTEAPRVADLSQLARMLERF